LDNYKVGDNRAESVGPYRLYGPVVSGFKRGSKLLGFPTANLSPESFGSTMKSAPRGVYAGWAQINDGPVLKTAISLGYNPTFNNQQETVEAYILHQFPHDFYGQNLRLIICAYIRPQLAFTTIETLINAIEMDVKLTQLILDEKLYQPLASDSHFMQRSQLSTSPCDCRCSSQHLHVSPQSSSGVSCKESPSS